MLSWVSDKGAEYFGAEEIKEEIEEVVGDHAEEAAEAGAAAVKDVLPDNDIASGLVDLA